MRTTILLLGLTLTMNVACVTEEVDEPTFRSLQTEEVEEQEEEQEVEEVVGAAPKAVLYDNCAPLSDCKDKTTCGAGRCWYQKQGSIWKIPNTDMDCHFTAAKACRCNVAQKAAVDAALIAKGYELTTEDDAVAVGDDADDAACEPAAVPDVEPLPAEPLNPVEPL